MSSAREAGADSFPIVSARNTSNCSRLSNSGGVPFLGMVDLQESYYGGQFSGKNGRTRAMGRDALVIVRTPERALCVSDNCFVFRVLFPSAARRAMQSIPAYLHSQPALYQRMARVTTLVIYHAEDFLSWQLSFLLEAFQHTRIVVFSERPVPSLALRHVGMRESLKGDAYHAFLGRLQQRRCTREDMQRLQERVVPVTSAHSSWPRVYAQQDEAGAFNQMMQHSNKSNERIMGVCFSLSEFAGEMTPDLGLLEKSLMPTSRANRLRVNDRVMLFMRHTRFVRGTLGTVVGLHPPNVLFDDERLSVEVRRQSLRIRPDTPDARVHAHPLQLAYAVSLADTYSCTLAKGVFPVCKEWGSHAQLCAAFARFEGFSKFVLSEFDEEWFRNFCV